MTKIVNVGLLGFGMAGSVFHGPLITSNSNFQLKKVLERSTNKSKQKYPFVEVARTIDEVLLDNEIDLIVIGTPNNTHFDYAKAALEANKHVVVDKPFTVKSSDARELINLAKNRGRMLSVFQSRRWDGDFKTVKKVIENKWLGDLVEYEVHYDRYRPALRENSWKEKGNTGTGVLYDLGSHLIDQALLLFGTPMSVWADLRSQRPNSDIVDNFEIILNYSNLKVTLKSSLLVREPGPHFILSGIKGSFVKYGMDPQELALNEGSTPLSAGWGSDPVSQWGILNTEIEGIHFKGTIETVAGAYQDYYKNIYDVIVSGKELEVKPEQALRTIEIIELANQSHIEGKVILIK